MSDPRPLLDGPLPPEVADLLRAAAADAPPEPAASRARVAASMAASSSVEVTSSTPKAIGGGPLSLTVVGLVLVAGAATFVATTTAEPTATVVSAPVAPTTATRPELPSVDSNAASAPPSLRVEDLPAASPALGPSNAPAPPRAANVDELALIDAARADLTAGRPDDALRRVAAYRALGHARTYAVEADVIEIEALSVSGRTAEARERGARFLARHPRSPYEQRIRALLQEQP
ncbi:MAG: hypothetical protein KF850_16455 [Labilithrix sp.]|nr:hypothetical protein [Labilithrix sp.]